MKRGPEPSEPAPDAIGRSIRSSRGAGRLQARFCRQFGPRPPASAGMRRAQSFLLREWDRLGASRLETETVRFDGWREGPATVEMLAPRRRRIAGVQAVHSAAGTVSGNLVDGGALGFADLARAGDKARGSILLVDGHQIGGGQFEPIQKRMSLAEAAGAAAVLLVGWHAGLPSIQFLNRSRIPVASVALASARLLRGALRRGPVRLRLQTRGRTERVACRNLICELGPKGAPEMLVACAHLDTFHLAPAALDNTSGVVTMTEIARALAPHQNRFVRRLRLVAFTGEEYGYAGSKAYVRRHAAELDALKFVYSFDCMFAGTARGIAVMWSPALRDYLGRSLRRSRPEVDVRNHFCMSSDYLPFMLAGVPAARPADWSNSFPSWTHTTMDSGRRVPARWIKANAETGAAVLWRMLTDPKPLPTRRNSPDEVEKLIGRDRAGESLRWQILLPT